MSSEFGIAIHALVYLNHRGVTTCSEELAHNICTNPVQVRKVMAKLKKANLITTKEGADGGYLFKGSPSELSLQEVGEAIDAQFVTPNWRSGDTDNDCLIASGMADVMNGIYDHLDTLCKEYLKDISIASIDHIIFHKE